MTHFTSGVTPWRAEMDSTDEIKGSYLNIFEHHTFECIKLPKIDEI